MGQPTLTTTLIYSQTERENKERVFQGKLLRADERERRVSFHLPRRTNPVTGKLAILCSRTGRQREEFSSGILRLIRGSLFWFDVHLSLAYMRTTRGEVRVLTPSDCETRSLARPSCCSQPMACR